MTYVQNLTTDYAKLSDTEFELELGWLPPGASFWHMSDDAIQTIVWTNGTGSRFIHHSEMGLAKYTVTNNADDSYRTDLSWVYSAPLIVWALWLCSKMIMRMFARAFGSNNANVVD